MAGKKPIPKTQAKLSQDSISNYVNPDTGAPINGKYGVDSSKSRVNQISRKNGKVKNLTVGIKDIAKRRLL